MSLSNYTRTDFLACRSAIKSWQHNSKPILLEQYLPKPPGRLSYRVVNADRFNIIQSGFKTLEEAAEAGEVA